MLETRKTLVRIAAIPDGSDCWPNEYFIQLAPDAALTRMHKVECSECKTNGTITLFTSTVCCDRCLGRGYYAEGYSE